MPSPDPSQSTDAPLGIPGWEWLRPDPAWEEAKRRLWAMTPDQRVRAMRAGQLSTRLCLHWASRAPEEVPLLNGEWEFIAIFTPEIVDADDADVQPRSAPRGDAAAARHS